MTGRMVSKFPGKCLECSGVWKANDMIFYNEGKIGYFCSEPCAVSYAEWLAASVGAPICVQTPSNPQYSSPTANIAVNAKETPYKMSERDAAMAAAHMENMTAHKELIEAMGATTIGMDHIRAALDKIAKWLVDDAMANRGLKL
jgi:hypothetical protein